MSTDMVLHSSSDIFTSDGFATTMKICEALVKSGILPRGIDNPYKAFAIVQKGREIGVGPMRALTGIHLIEGKPVVSPELKLEQFRERGGRVKWLRSDNTVAELWLKAPNGDEHTETVTLADMQTAGVAGKDNWRKYPKSMLRARAVGFGLRALGEGDGSYTPDELGAPVNGEGEYMAPDEVRAVTQIRASIEDSPRAAAPPPPPPPPPSSGGVTVEMDWSQVAELPDANKVPHEGVARTLSQNARLHALKGDCGGVFSGDDDSPTSLWRVKVLSIYRDVEGKRITSSKHLSRNQAGHLIERMWRYVQKSGARLAQANQEVTGNLAATVPPVDLLEALHAEFPTATEEDEWLHSLGYQTADDIPEESRQMVLLLLRSIKQPAAYATNLTKARTLGHVR